MDEEIVTKVELSADSKQILTDFADEAKEWCDNEKKKVRMNTKETMNVYYYKKDYWTLLSKDLQRDRYPLFTSQRKGSREFGR